MNIKQPRGLSNSQLGSHEQLSPTRKKAPKYKHTELSAQEVEQIQMQRLFNQSMLQLQDPDFINNELDSFQNKLNANQKSGFCRESRLKSLLLSDAQGYKKCKQALSSRVPRDNSKKERNQAIAEGSKDSSSSSQLQYSSDSVQNKRKEIVKKQQARVRQLDAADSAAGNK